MKAFKFINIRFLSLIIFILFTCTIANDYLGVNDLFKNKEGEKSKLTSPILTITNGSDYVKINNTIQITASGSNSGVIYIWSASSGNIDQAGSTVTYTAPGTTGSAVVYCRAVKSGYTDSSKSTLTLTITAEEKLPLPDISLNPTTSYRNNNETSVLTASIPGYTGVTFTWHITGLGTIDGGTIDVVGDSVTYQAPSSGTGSATISCYGSKGTYTDSDPRSQIIYVTTQQQAASPSLTIISGTSNLLINESIDLQASGSGGSATYHWSVTGGGTLVISGTQNELATYTAPSSSSNPVISCYASVAGYIDSYTTNLNVTVRLGTVLEPTITGPNICYKNSTIILQIAAPQSGATYYWSTNSVNSTINPTGNSVVFSSNTVESVIVSCYGTKGDYYNSTTATWNVSVQLPKLTAPTISSKNSMVINKTLTLTASGSQPGSTYHWTENGSGSLNSSTGNSVIYTATGIKESVTIQCYASNTDYQNSDTTSKDIRVVDYNPHDISNLIIWYDAADSAASSITLNAGNVSSWFDKSQYAPTLSTANNATNGTIAQQPLYVYNGLNNKNIINFDGATDSLLIGAQAELGYGQTTTSRTISFVLRTSNNTSSSTKQVIYEEGVHSTSGISIYILSNNLYINFWNNTAPYTFEYAYRTVTDNTSYMLTVVFTSTTQILAYLNGQNMTVVVPGTISALINHGNYGNCLGYINGNYTRFHDNSTSTGFGRFKGDMAEIIMYNNELSFDDIDDLEAYLADKWGITY